MSISSFLSCLSILFPVPVRAANRRSPWNLPLNALRHRQAKPNKISAPPLWPTTQVSNRISDLCCSHVLITFLSPPECNDDDSTSCKNKRFWHCLAITDYESHFLTAESIETSRALHSVQEKSTKIMQLLMHRIDPRAARHAI